MAPIFPAVDQWNIREIIPRRIDPWGCFVGQLVPLHEIIPPGCHGWKTHHLRTEHLWRAWRAPWTFRSTFLCKFFFGQDFQKPRYCISLWWRSMLLFEHRVSVSSQLSYQGGDRLSNCCYRVRLHLTCNVQACTSLLLQVVAQSPQTKHLKQPHDFQPGNPYLN